MAELSPELRKRLSEAIERSRQLAEAKKKPDAKDREETTASREAAELQSLMEDVEDKRHFRALREKYARWVYKYLVWYSICCLILLLAAGSHPWGFTLPESVLDFLVGSTAASAIGLVLAVTHGLFKRS